jgi:hypothetical protein
MENSSLSMYLFPEIKLLCNLMTIHNVPKHSAESNLTFQYIHNMTHTFVSFFVVVYSYGFKIERKNRRCTGYETLLVLRNNEQYGTRNQRFNIADTKNCNGTLVVLLPT